MIWNQASAVKGIKVNCQCNFSIGDLVDWHRFGWKSTRKHTTQNAFWHGEVIEDLGIQTLGRETGHVLKVKWTCSNWWGKEFDKEPEGGSYVASGPVHIQNEMCIEIERCAGSGTKLHPKRLCN